MTYEKIKEYLETHAVNCNTEEEARELLGFLHKKGFEWFGGEPLYAKTLWSIDKIHTTYSFDFGCIACNDIAGDEFLGFTIVAFKQFKEEFMKQKIEKGDTIKFRKDATLYDLVKDNWNGCQLSTLRLLREYEFEPMEVSGFSHFLNNPKVDDVVINKNVIEIVKKREYKEYTIEELEKKLGEKIKIKGEDR